MPGDHSHSFCSNCKRRGIPTIAVSWSDVCRKTRKTYCNFRRPIGHLPTAIHLCIPHCERYMACPNPDEIYIWPAMIWKFLSCGPSDPLLLSMNPESKWAYVPSEWRAWWLPSMNDLYGDVITMDFPPAKFVLATRDYEYMQEAISQLEWKKLQHAMDKYVAYPTVRCPWGCSEFLHRCNFLPLAEYLSFKSNWNFEIPANSRQWMLGTNPGFPSSCLVLENPEFEVNPCLHLDDSKGLCILCCRNHNSSCTERYIHVPVNPLGSLHAPHSDQYSQTTLQSRTLRRTKRNLYSDTFQTNLLMGGYDGLDSCYLTKSMRLGTVHNATLFRQFLYISGRSDVRGYISQLAEDKQSRSFLPQRVIDDLLRNSNVHFPDVESSASDCLAASTFISIEDAVCLQEHSYMDSTQSIISYVENVNDGGYDEREVFFHAPWPTFLLRIHEVGGYGEQPSVVRNKHDSLVAWCMTAVVSSVPVAWTATALAITRSTDPIGYLMRLSWEIVNKGKNRKGPRGSTTHFSLMKKKTPQVLQCLGITHPNGRFRQQFTAIFEDVKEIAVVDGDWNESMITEHTEVVISTPEHDLDSNCIHEVRDGWDLVLFILKDRYESGDTHPCLFLRHGGMLNNKWWMQKNDKFQRSLPFPIPLEGTLMMLVYVKIHPNRLDTLRSTYFRLLGGQMSCYCRSHKDLLVLNPGGKSSVRTSSKRQCSLRSDSHPSIPCDKTALFICGHRTCKIGICEPHFADLHKNTDHFSMIFPGGFELKEKGLHSIPDISDSDVDSESGNTTDSDSRHSTFSTETDDDVPVSNDDSGAEDDSASDTDEELSSETELFQDRLFKNAESCLTSYEEKEVSAMGPTDSYDFPLDLLDETPEETNEYMRDFPMPLTTIASGKPLTLEFNENSDVPSAPLHILLNHQGHLLIRQKAKLRLNRRHKNFFQHGIMTNLQSRTIPLAYGEAYLKPSIFYFDFPDGSIPGALPTALWADDKFLNRLGVASMRDHITTRIQNPALLCSTDSQYHFLEFDTLVNLGLRGMDTILVLHRGFAEKQNGQGATFKTNEGNEELRGEQVEDQSNVHRLAALVAESPPDYFYTQSCNQTTCPGVKRIRSWVTSIEAMKLLTGPRYNLTETEASVMLRDSAAAYIHRTWNEIAYLWMKYIIYSPEKPLHEIDWAWYRQEFQDENGNPSHIHAIIKTKIDTSTPQGLEIVLQKIRGSLADLVHAEDIARMRTNGVIDSIEVLRSILEDAEKFLTHRCHARCQIPKLGPNGETVFHCKAPSNWLLTLTPHLHTMQTLTIPHTKIASDILIDLGLAVDDGRHGCIPIHPLLTAKRHVPKCTARDGKFSPTSPDIFLRMPSASNLQFTTGHTVAAYLTKYVASIDKVSVVFIKPPLADNANVLRAEHRPLHNTKIASVHFHNIRRKKSTSKTHVDSPGNKSARPITHMECLSVLESHKLVMSTRTFIHMPTTAREYRSAMRISYRRCPSDNVQDLQAVLAVTNQTVRVQLQFPSWRMFTTSQLKVIADELQAPLQTDSTTFFSMRPPELLFIREQILYLKWFNRHTGECDLLNPQKALDSLREKFLNRDLHKSYWMDGFNHMLKIRGRAIEPCFVYLTSCPESYFGNGQRARRNKRYLMNFFSELLTLYNIYVNHDEARRTPFNLVSWISMSERFLDHNISGHLPVIWITPIYPRRTTAFLVQLLLQKGLFITEYDLMNSGSLREAFITGQLLDTRDSLLSARRLLRRYILENLNTYPGGTFQFDRNVADAKSAIYDLMLGTSTTTVQCPSVLFSHMVQDTDEHMEDFILQERARFIDSLCNDFTRYGYGHILPTKERIQLCRKGNYLSDLETSEFFPPPIHDRQNVESYEEQRALMVMAQSCYNNYINPCAKHRNIVICGGPGVGKTTVCQFISLFLLSKGLNVTPTSLVADRSKELGGTHFHKLLSLTGDSNSRSTGRQAEKAIRDLYRKPEILGFLRTLDAINLDELGVFPAENVAIFDMVLRYVRNSHEFMGGLFVYCTLDHLQLLPVRGTPALLSMYVINEFSFFLLKESVRASNCKFLREIGLLTRTFDWTDDIKLRLAALLREHCVFVENFDDPRIPEDAVYVFGRKAPCREAEKMMIHKMRSLYGEACIDCVATDEESATGGDWRPASAPTKQRLATKEKRSSTLLFHPKARFEFTDNEKNFNQGQLALLLDVPDPDVVSTRRPLELWRGPTGEKSFPPSIECTPSILRQRGWIPIKVSFSVTRGTSVDRGIQGRRWQYPLRPRIALTIHACMGSTLSAIVTALIPPPGSRLNFSLWEKAQIVVLVSRTELAKRIFFVGDREATIRHILEVLEKPHRFLAQIHNLLQHLFRETQQTTGLPGRHHLTEQTIYRPCDAVVCQTPIVYLLVSTRNTNYTYIGQTENMRIRLIQHNSGTGAAGTAIPVLMPWAFMAYITGLAEKSDRLSLEALWKATGSRRNATTVDSYIAIASDLVANANSILPPSQPKLRLVVCGSVIRQLHSHH